MNEDIAAPVTGFEALALPEALLRVVRELGYDTPSPIQAQTIPHLLAGRDLLGQAQTGTGKTAAFALPILARVELGQFKQLQALVLTPTRELGIQVSEALRRYASGLPGFRTVAIYGGQSYHPQLTALSRGVHVVVGTPGRIIDHIERGSLDLSQLRHLVLDEADEMLRMGFIDDVERILRETPATRQTALFSATLPPPIRRIAGTYMRTPVEVTIAAKHRTADNIRQRYWLAHGLHKLDALTRILEVEPADASIVFTRTRQAAEELAGQLQSRGFAAVAIHGDVQQSQRERSIAMLRDGAIDVLVATDVAARGLDVDRVTRVINYDIPTDTESYVHRIGRTGRAGRSGEAILFVAPRERSLLHAIEHATRAKIGLLELPTVKMVNDVRINRFKRRIQETITDGELEPFKSIVAEMTADGSLSAVDVAAALARMARGEGSFLMTPPSREDRRPPPDEVPPPRPRLRRPREPEAGMTTYRVEVGHIHGVRPSHLVGTIANEAHLAGPQIGRIELFDEHALVDLPEDLPDAAIDHLRAVAVLGVPLRISRADPNAVHEEPSHRPAPGPRRGPKPFGRRPFRAHAHGR